MTNFESRFLALLLAHRRKDLEPLSHVIAQFANTERNFILEKDQTTVELAKEKQEAESLERIIDLVQRFGEKKPK